MIVITKVEKNPKNSLSVSHTQYISQIKQK